MVHFVGAGPGAPDLITIRGRDLIEKCDVLIYAGSLVNPELLQYAKEGCEIHNSAYLNLDEVIDIMKKADAEGKTVVRLHTGDPSIYGAIREQMDELNRLGIEFDDTPGVSSFCGAAAALNLEYTLPGVSQSVIITRMEGRTKVPEKESVEALASHDSTMVFFLSAGNIEGLANKLMEAGRPAETPCAIVYKATWPDEKKIVCTLRDAAQMAEKEGISKTALIIVGDVVEAGNYEKSRLYDKDFETEYRKAHGDK
jgi:precorrin-4/cobalt-precorrin-4 C11-methyltransferase